MNQSLLNSHIMKKVLLILPMLVACFFIGCSSDDYNDNKEINLLNGTKWSYTTSTFNHIQKEFEDKENKSNVEYLLRICPSINYTIEDYNIGEEKFEINLCEHNGHSRHEKDSLSFYDQKCHYEYRSIEYIQDVTKTTETATYKFKEGNYIGSFGGSSYFGVTVKSYGVYRSTIGGDVVVIPLDGNYCYNMSSVKYCSEVLEQEIDSDTKILYYDFDKDNISIFDGSYDIKGSYSDYYMNLNFNLPYERSVMLSKMQ